MSTITAKWSTFGSLLMAVVSVVAGYPGGIVLYLPLAAFGAFTWWYCAKDDRNSDRG